MYQGLTLDLVNEAVDLVKPTIIRLLRSERACDKNIYIVVGLQGSDFLYEGYFGEDPSKWEHDYGKFARAKARACQRTGMVGRTFLRDAPWLVKPSDTWYPGGVFENGLVVAASGPQDHFDEMISWMILAAIQGLCRDEMSKIKDDDPGFFGS